MIYICVRVHKTVQKIAVLRELFGAPCLTDHLQPPRLFCVPNNRRRKTAEFAAEVWNLGNLFILVADTVSVYHPLSLIPLRSSCFHIGAPCLTDHLQPPRLFCVPNTRRRKTAEFAVEV